MKPNIIISSLCALALLGSTGCNTTGTGTGAASSSNTAAIAGSILPAVLGGVAGGFAGDALFDSSGGAIGGTIVGVIAATQIAEQIKRTSQQQISEAYVQGKREARVEAANEFWDERTFADGNHPDITGAESQLRQVQYDTRYTESVMYGSSYISTDQQR
jgi:hypothetical protein